jgi:hypothetical protein
MAMNSLRRLFTHVRLDAFAPDGPAHQEPDDPQDPALEVDAGVDMESHSLTPIDMPDKRYEDRMNKNLQISYATLSNIAVEPFEFGNTVTTDISSRGLSLVTDEPIDTPVLLQAKIHIPGDRRGLILLGRTVYCNPLEDSDVYRVGIKFIGLLPGELTELLNGHGESAAPI